MERKGSGFEKIISGYEFQINYDESKKPKFRSDRYQFTVVMPNLNYDVLQDVTTNVISDVTTNVTKDKLDDKILSLIRKDSRISTRKMAERLGVNVRTIRKKKKKMDHVNYIGRGSNGHWKILEEE